MTSVQSPYAGTQAVLRAVALLKAFSDSRPELSLSDLARQVGLNKTTAYRMLTALESEGMVLRHPQTGNYRLGPGTIELGGRALRTSDLRTAARVELADLATQTGETPTLEILAGQQVLVLDEILSAHRLTGAQTVGTTWPIHSTSTGKAIAAFLADAEQLAIIHGQLQRYTRQTITEPTALAAEFAEIRKRGYSIAVEEVETGYAAVAAPVLDVDGVPVAAISVGGPVGRMDAARIEQIAVQVQESAGRLSKALGYRKLED
jgi:IclR family transcriptional regulator, acetate operon repressor